MVWWWSILTALVKLNWRNSVKVPAAWMQEILQSNSQLLKMCLTVVYYQFCTLSGGRAQLAFDHPIELDPLITNVLHWKATSSSSDSRAWGSNSWGESRTSCAQLGRACHYRKDIHVASFQLLSGSHLLLYAAWLLYSIGVITRIWNYNNTITSLYTFLEKRAVSSKLTGERENYI